MLRFFLILMTLPAPALAQVLDPTNVAEFWEYIEENETMISSDTNIVLMFDEIEFELNKVHRDLVFEFSSETIQPRRLVISADGILSNFPAVEELVRATPSFRNLEIIAFRPPLKGPLAEVLVLGDVSLRADDLSFIYFTDRDRFDLVLIHDDFDTREREQAIAISFLFLDSAIGEYRVATEVGAIDFVSKGAVPATYQQLPIEKLPDELDKFIHARMP